MLTVVNEHIIVGKLNELVTDKISDENQPVIVPELYELTVFTKRNLKNGVENEQVINEIEIMIDFVKIIIKLEHSRVDELELHVTDDLDDRNYVGNYHQTLI